MGYIGPGWDDPQLQERIVREQRAEGERMARFYQQEARLKEERENRARRARWDARRAEQLVETDHRNGAGARGSRRSAI